MREVFCRKYQQNLPGLRKPPFPNPMGDDLFATVSQKAWDEWVLVQTKLINEKELKLFDPNARKYLHEQMYKFLDNQPIDKVGIDE